MARGVESWAKVMPVVVLVAVMVVPTGVLALTDNARGDGVASHLSVSTVVPAFLGNDAITLSTPAQPSAGLSVSINVSQPSPVPYNVQINFTSHVGGGTPPYAYLWFLGDGTNATRANTSIQGEQAGSYQAVLVVSDNIGDTGIGHASYSVAYAYGGLNVFINASTPMPAAGTSVQFTTTERGGLGTNYSYAWSFGDGASGSGATTSHVFHQGGLYPVIVTVSDIWMEHATYYYDIYVPPSNPAVSIKSTTLSGFPPLAVTFNGTFTGGFIDASCSTGVFPPRCSGTGAFYHWTFGDGTPAAGTVNTTHTFTTPGNYPVQLTVTDITADSGSSTVAVHVLAPVLSTVAVSPPWASIEAGSSRTFTATVGCSGGACPSGAAYFWTLNNTLGSLNHSTGSSATFAAGSNSGATRLTVDATLNGKTAWANVTISITAKSVTPPSNSTTPHIFLGLPDSEGYILIGVIVALVVAAVAVLSLHKRKGAQLAPPPTSSSSQPSAGPPPPP